MAGRAAAMTAVMLMVAGSASAVAAIQPYTFAYRYPAAAARYPTLRRWLDADRAATRRKTAADAAADQREARNGKFPYRPHDVGIEWKVVTETPRFLSLSAERFSYTGGAHGMTISQSLVWDKPAAQRLDPRALFVSPAAIQAAIGAAYCRELDRARADKRQERIIRGDWPNQCVAVKDTTLLLGSTNRQRIDRIGLIADAYVAGPYVEGPYEVTLPVTPALLAAVKPAYRSAFAAR